MKNYLILAACLMITLTGCQTSSTDQGDTTDNSENETAQSTTADYVKVWNSADFDLLGQILADNFVRKENSKQTAGSLEEMEAVITGFRNALADLEVVINHEHFSDGFGYLHWTATGTNNGIFNGLPPTGRGVSFSGMTLAKFNSDQTRIIKEEIYYDQLDLYGQLGYTIEELYKEEETEE